MTPRARDAGGCIPGADRSGQLSGAQPHAVGPSRGWGRGRVREGTVAGRQAAPPQPRPRLQLSVLCDSIIRGAPDTATLAARVEGAAAAGMPSDGGDSADAGHCGGSSSCSHLGWEEGEGGQPTTWRAQNHLPPHPGEICGERGVGAPPSQRDASAAAGKGGGRRVQAGPGRVVVSRTSHSPPPLTPLSFHLVGGHCLPAPAMCYRQSVQKTEERRLCAGTSHWRPHKVMAVRPAPPPTRCWEGRTAARERGRQAPVLVSRTRRPPPECSTNRARTCGHALLTRFIHLGTSGFWLATRERDIRGGRRRRLGVFLDALSGAREVRHCLAGVADRGLARARRVAWASLRVLSPATACSPARAAAQPASGIP